MAKFLGRLVNLGIARETTRGTAVAPTYWVPKASFSVFDKIVKARSEGDLNNIADSEEAFVTTKFASGEFSGEIRSKSFPLILYATLGTLSTAGPTDSAYTHSFTLQNDNQCDSLSLSVKDGISSFLHPLSMLNTLEIEVVLDQVARFTANFLSKVSKDWATFTPSYVAESKFTKKHLSFKVAADLSSLDAASAISLKRIRLTINKNTAIDDVLGTLQPEDILNHQISVEGELELNYEDRTYRNYMLNGNHKAIEIKLTNTDDTIGTGTNPSLTIRMPRVDFFGWTPNFATDDIVKQTISFKGSRDVSGSNDIISTCQVVNNVASY